ncbi:DUF58 domain-containing protein [Cytobacillus gottheilii]|uniref:DUF58 domain-containing protein n=1 Tax=Cytobacillus gottheilii TaxID=859144 RepID=A0ABX8FE27_9BACI|nr:DUF58 domain-containing protein [Cytobacillus gottheilii]QVY62022.1 DUF58 domain-containing protein [Cytobacillus gottheilii]
MKQSLKVLKGVWKLVVLFFLIILTFSYAMFQGGFVSWFLFYSFLPFALYGLFLVFYPFQRIEAVRSLSKHEFNAGEQLKVSIELERSIQFPLFFLVVEDCIDEKLNQFGMVNKSKTLMFPGFQKKLSYEYVLESLPRGEHIIPAIRLKTGDPLGLIEKEIIVKTEARFVVYPSYEELIYKPFENHYDQGMTASRERVQRDTSMAIGIREYQPGDRFSWINWKATAKRNDIMTKEFEQRQSHDVYIMMDCSPHRSFEAIVSFSASIMRAILRKGAQVGFLTSSADRAAFPIRGGETQQQQLFYHLAKLRDESAVSFDRVLETEKFLAQQNFNLMLVTGELTKALIEKAGYFSSRKGIVTIFLIKGKNDSSTELELALKSESSARGIRVVMIHDGNFSEAFSEVRKA